MPRKAGRKCYRPKSYYKKKVAAAAAAASHNENPDEVPEVAVTDQQPLEASSSGTNYPTDDPGVANNDQSKDDEIICLTNESGFSNGRIVLNPAASVTETEPQLRNEIQLSNVDTVVSVESNSPVVKESTTLLAPPVELPTSAIIATGVRKLQCLLPADWICCADATGFSVCFLNLGTPKAIQRQIFMSFSGEAKAYVHSSPCPSLDEIFSFVHIPIKFCRDSMDDFCKSVMSLVEIVLQHRVCIGVNSKKFRDRWSSIPKSSIDLNPYLETSYDKTLRSSKCSKLIANDSKEPRCDPCSKLLKYVKKNASGDPPATQ